MSDSEPLMCTSVHVSDSVTKRVDWSEAISGSRLDGIVHGWHVEGLRTRRVHVIAFSQSLGVPSCSLRLRIACGSRRQHSHVVSARSLRERNSPVVSASSSCDQASHAHLVGCLGMFQIRSGFPLCSFGSAAVSGFWHDGLCKHEPAHDTLLVSTANWCICSTPPASAA